MTSHPVGRQYRRWKEGYTGSQQQCLMRVVNGVSAPLCLRGGRYPPGNADHARKILFWRAEAS